MTTDARIPKKTLGPAAFVVLAIIVLALVGWMLGTAFVNPDMSFEQMMRLG